MLNPYRFWIITGILFFLLFSIFIETNITNNYYVYNITLSDINEDITNKIYNEESKTELDNILKKVKLYEKIFNVDKFKDISCKKITSINNFTNYSSDMSYNNQLILSNILNIQNNLLSKCNDYIINRKKEIAKLKKEKELWIIALRKMKQRIWDKIKSDKLISEKKNIHHITKIKDLSNISIIIQKRNSNTCVIDNLWMMIEYEQDRKIDKTKIYTSMGKKIGDFWHTWLFSIWQYGGNFREVDKDSLLYDRIEKKYVYTKYIQYNKSKHDKIPEYKDFKKLYEYTNIKTADSSNIWYMKWVLRNNKMVLLEVPMSIIYPNEKKWINSNIFHAITVTDYHEDTNTISYINTLNWKIEELDFNLITYDKSYLKYPFRYLTGDFEEVKGEYLL